MDPPDRGGYGWNKGFVLERDEEGEWRALLSADELEASKNIDVEQVKAIAICIEDILR